MKELIKSLVPPFFLNTVQKIINRNYGWKGDYKTWEEAQADATGYDTDKIVEAVESSLLKVKKGEVAYERDSVLFDEIQYSWPLLSGLMFCCSQTCGILKVLDFGGSLGSTYYQNKTFLDELDDVSWSIVEQKHFVDIGKEKFEDNRLKFFYSISESIEQENPNVLLLSSVLQYLEDPYKLLYDVIHEDFEYILIDRTPFSKKNRDEIRLQVVPSYIYEASYPCWFFDQLKLVKYFEMLDYHLIEDFKGADGENSDYIFKGMILRKINV